MHAYEVPGGDPYERFRRLLAEAESVGTERLPEPTAFCLATVSADGQPSARMLLLKRLDTGFVFHTNLRSRKGRELAGNPRAAMCFHWQPLERQVRVEGQVAPVTDDEADLYFRTRPRLRQLGAWASDQSDPIAAGASLEERVAEVARRFEGQDVPRPSHWSGFRLVPHAIEFWINGDGRLHVRHRYERSGDGWRVETLYP